MGYCSRGLRVRHNRATIAFSFGVVGGGARLTGGTPEVPVTAHAEHPHPASSLRVNSGLPLSE